MINLEKLGRRVALLKEGKTLYMDHLIYGRYKVNMNPQQNRIFVETADGRARYHEDQCRLQAKDNTIHKTSDSVRDTIEKFLLWDCGEWTVELEPPFTEYVEVKHGGKYEPV